MAGYIQGVHLPSMRSNNKERRQQAIDIMSLIIGERYNPAVYRRDCSPRIQSKADLNRRRWRKGNPPSSRDLWNGPGYVSTSLSVALRGRSGNRETAHGPMRRGWFKPNLPHRALQPGGGLTAGNQHVRPCSLTGRSLTWGRYGDSTLLKPMG